MFVFLFFVVFSLFDGFRAIKSVCVRVFIPDNVQTGKHDAIVSNIHGLLANLAFSFEPEQLEHLFALFQRSWGGTRKEMEKMLEFIGKLAEDDANGTMAGKVGRL